MKISLKNIMKFGYWSGLLSLICFSFMSFAQTGPANLNVSGALFLPSGLPVTNASVNFRLEILNKDSSCLLYSEQHLGEDLSASKGQFALAIGRGSSPNNLLETSAVFTSKIFENSGVIAGGWPGCPAGANLASGDERTVRVYYDLGGGFVAMSPDVPIASSAYAMIADTLQGRRPTDFVQMRDDMTYDLNQGNVENVFSSTNYARLLQLLNPSAAIGFSGQRLTNLADPSSAQDATTKNYADTKLAGQTIDLADVAPGAGGGKVLSWDAVASKWVAMAQTVAGTAGGDLSGSYPNPVVANLAIGTSKLADNAVTSAKIASTGIAPNQLVITDNVAGATLKYATCANNEILKYVTGTGWQCATAASLSAVLSVNGKTGVVVLNGADLGLGTASMRDVGVAATNVPELNGSGKLAVGVIPDFGGDLSGAYASAFVSGLQGRSVASTAPNANEVLRWNNSLTRWEPSALVDNVGITALTGDVSASGTGSVAATLTNGVVTTPKMFATPGANRLVATDSTTGATLVPFTCNLNESLHWTASGWACANPATAFLANNVIVDGGNARGANISIGTSDNFALNFITNNTSKLTVLPNGNVGIGTTSPSNPLTVNGTMITNNSITVGGNIFMLTGGTAADPALSWNFSTGLFYPAANVMAVSTNDIERLRISAAGNVGIGTTNPNRLLSVNGAINVAPSALPGSPAAGDLAFDSASSNNLKFYNGTAWQTVGTSNATGDFMANGSIAMTDQFRSIAGSALSPGMTFVGDTDNGIFAPSADNFAISTNGSERLRITSGGQVGVGLSNPIVPLHISNAINTSIMIDSYATVTPTLTFRSARGTQAVPTATQTDDGLFQIGGRGHIGSGFTSGSKATISAFASEPYNGVGTGAYLTFATTVTGGVVTGERMRIDPSGYVGIGTTSPSRLLHVAGPMHITPAALPASPGAGDLAIDSAASNSLKYFNGTGWVSLASFASGDFMANGSVAMTGQLRGIAGTATTPGFTFTGDTDNGIFSPATDNFAVATNGSEALRVLANGNVGIGNTNPGNRLSVADSGNGAVNGNVSTTNSFAGTGAWAGFVAEANSSGITTHTGMTSNIFSSPTFYPDLGASTGFLRTGGNNGLRITSATNAASANIQFYTNDGTITERMRIARDGKVGIGTTAPLTQLHVVTDASDSAMQIGPSLSASSANAAIIMRGKTGGTATGQSVVMSDNSNNLTLYPAVGRDLKFLNGAATLTTMILKDSGAVGIGTTSPTAGTILDLNGTGTAQSSMLLPRDLTANRPTTPVESMFRYNTATRNIEFYDGTGWISPASNATGSFNTAVAVSFAHAGVYAPTGTIDSFPPTAISYGLQSTNTSSTDGAYAPLRLRATNASSRSQNAVIAAVSNTGAATYTPSIVISQQTGATTYAERLRIDSNGYVGIGVTSAQNPLDVSAPVSGQIASFASSTGAASFAISAQPANTASFLLRKAVLNGGRWSVKANSTTESGSNAGSDFQIEGIADNGASIANHLTILRSSGYVGIGVTAPGMPLDVNGIARAGRLIANGASAAGTPHFSFNSDSDTGMYLIANDTVGFSTGATERMRITPTGSVGIGTSNPGSSMLAVIGQFGSAGNAYVGSSAGQYVELSTHGAMAGHISLQNGGADVLYLPTGTSPGAGQVGIGTTAPSEMLEVNGSVKASSYITASDRRLKTDIRVVEGWDLVKKLRGVRYQLIANQSRELGFIAQEVEEVFPEAVVTNAQTGMKGVKYQSLIPPLLEAIKDTHDMCEANRAETQKELDSLRAEVRELRKIVEEIQKARAR